ncbi:MAG: hypothetical protein GKR94_23155 [Gammaproteobacteria bacterium]|nr:hypothetical protein [Gammaproteobacteria bacterium]
MSQIDLNSPPAGHNYSVSIDREETNNEMHVRLFKEIVIFIVAIAFVVIIAWICLSTLQDAHSTPEAKKWAMSILSAATGGILGYLLKK